VERLEEIYYEQKRMIEGIQHSMIEGTGVDSSSKTNDESSDMSESISQEWKNWYRNKCSCEEDKNN
jgi:hypothetical protein